MTRVVAFVPDLLFGSKVQSLLTAGGHEVQLLGDPARARAEGVEADVVVVDLTDEAFGGLELADLGDARTLAFYSHVDVDTRRRALEAGFDLVVPRSRMVREGADLVASLAAGAQAAGQRARRRR